MAYIHYHNLIFNNPIAGEVIIRMYKKDGDPDWQVTDLVCTNASRQFMNGDGQKFDTIIASELVFGFYLNKNSPYTYDDFLVSFHDEWKVELYNEQQIEFIGWLIPDEGDSEFRDLPYDVQLRATDGLGFLKNDSLSDDAGNAFTSVTTLLDYIVGALVKTRLQLNIRTYCSIYESSMNDRLDNIRNDMFNQAKLDYRTFQGSDNSPVDCYSALEKILKEGFNIYQWFGRWVITRIGEMQTNEGPKIYYTEYDWNGVDIDANLEGFDPAIVARNQTLHPINADQHISSMFAIKQAKHNYNYNSFSELPKNNKFERGTVFETGNAEDDEDFDNDGDTTEIIGTYKKYTINDWEQGIIDQFDIPHPTIFPTALKYYRYSVFNQFGVEIDRRIAADTFDPPGTDQFILRSEPIPVKKGGKIRINLQKRFTNDFSTSGITFTVAAFVYIVKSDGSTGVGLVNVQGGVATNTGTWYPMNTNITSQLVIDYGPNQNTEEWNTLTVESLAIPFDGTLYYALRSNGPSSNTGPLQYYKDISLEYFPYVAGGYVPVKGDSWLTSQNLDYKDQVNEEVFISDSPERIFQGAILRNDGLTLTDKSWYRQNKIEAREFKELINLARYNAAYRRMKRITGTFGGTTWHPLNGNTGYEPLSFHRHFKFIDDPSLLTKCFVIVPPLIISYSSGEIKATFVEAYDSSTNDGNVEGDQHSFTYNFK
jgi:hypothetical protein